LELIEFSRVKPNIDGVDRVFVNVIVAGRASYANTS